MGMLGRIKKNKVMADFSNYIHNIWKTKEW